MVFFSSVFLPKAEYKSLKPCLLFPHLTSGLDVVYLVGGEVVYLILKLKYAKERRWQFYTKNNINNYYNGEMSDWLIRSKANTKED